MPIQVTAKSTSKAMPAFVLGILFLIGILAAVNWRLLLLAALLMAAGAGWWLHG